MIHIFKKFMPNEFKSNAKRIFKDFKDSLNYVFYRKYKKNYFNKIVFVCKGNVCRSVFAELYLKKNETLKLNMTSCGLDVNQGNNPPTEAIQVAAEFGIDLNNNVSKSINTLTLTKNDLIIAMEFDQYKRLIQGYPQYKNNVRLLKDYLPWPARLQCNIADPYGSDIEEFRRCFRTIKRALDGMVNELSDRPDRTSPNI